MAQSGLLNPLPRWSLLDSSGLRQAPAQNGPAAIDPGCVKTRPDDMILP